MQMARSDPAITTRATDLDVLKHHVLDLLNDALGLPVDRDLGEPCGTTRAACDGPMTIAATSVHAGLTSLTWHVDEREVGHLGRRDPQVDGRRVHHLLHLGDVALRRGGETPIARRTNPVRTPPQSPSDVT